MFISATLFSNTKTHFFIYTDQIEEASDSDSDYFEIDDSKILFWESKIKKKVLDKAFLKKATFIDRSMHEDNDWKILRMHKRGVTIDRIVAILGVSEIEVTEVIGKNEGESDSDYQG